ncbi:hypothetical protein B4092_5003 [Bacillus licheniformis]|uniref:SocA family protein n=1 Tax=Bacillus licheniformis TaxID=1402 RepID=A0AB37GNW7_BACLI|nr:MULTISPECIES: type II toxin-antitoxin system antitoxin SocA domain-containing protein [Bacillus subtilis group]AVI47061.1 hypothetical protein BL14DL4_01832 [Bacillus licheniformis]KYC72966.1 hypothetical protein B4092_5003 [Bacillus licheniformis]PAE72382.1 DUF4065 domain-containing protein [Bacillus licheniformis]QBR21625.1 DUF4065 domain-containing protein [Bacillus licheniformis]QPR74058.1 SocA family protein [Bacillus licheniformis]
MKISVAALYLINKSQPKSKYEITPKKLQKILYYAQAWFLANEGKPLFENDVFEAWRHGPVNHNIYNEYSAFGYSPIPPIGFSNELELYPLSLKEKEHLDKIWDVFGMYSGDELEYLTHQEDPWKITRGDLDPEAPTNKVIPEDIIRSYYTNLSHKVLDGTWKSPLNPEPRLDWLIKHKKKATANRLLKHVGTWNGNDLDDCINEVYNNRTEVQFH